MYLLNLFTEIVDTFYSYYRGAGLGREYLDDSLSLFYDIDFSTCYDRLIYI